MALVPHLGRDFILAREGGHAPRLGDIMAERFFAIDVFAHLHGYQRGQGVLVIRAGDEHHIQILAHFLEHPAVIREAFRLVRIAIFGFQPIFHHGQALLVGINYGDEVFIGRRLQVRGGAPSAATDDRAVQFARGLGGPDDAGIIIHDRASASHHGGVSQK